MSWWGIWEGGEGIGNVVRVFVRDGKGIWHVVGCL